jgi:6-phosphofructokinase 1
MGSLRIRCGYAGLIAGDFLSLGARDVGGIIQLGGTMLRSGRCPDFKTEPSRNEALRNLSEHQIEALVVIGGGGSQTGAHLLSQTGLPVIGVATTLLEEVVSNKKLLDLKLLETARILAR